MQYQGQECQPLVSRWESVRRRYTSASAWKWWTYIHLCYNALYSRDRYKHVSPWMIVWYLAKLALNAASNGNHLQRIQSISNSFCSSLPLLDNLMFLIMRRNLSLPSTYYVAKGMVCRYMSLTMRCMSSMRNGRSEEFRVLTCIVACMLMA